MVDDEEDEASCCSYVRGSGQRSCCVFDEDESEMLSDIERGLTPNPDVVCNQKIKFDKLMKYSLERCGADALATGHYARTSFGPDLEFYDPIRGVKLMKARDLKKDQTFFLSQVQQSALQRTFFPVGGMLKSEVKQLAIDIGLSRLAQKAESMGICFIGPRNFQSFISEYVNARDGNFVNLENGEVVGKHSGVHLWTIGQRCRIGGLPEPFFVVDKNPATQDILVVPGENHPALYTLSLFLEKPHWIHSPPRKLHDCVECAICSRYGHPSVGCYVSTASGSCLVVQLRVPLRAYGVFYRGEECLGSARILRPGPSLFMSDRMKKKKLILDEKDVEFMPIFPGDAGMPSESR
ncbi:unnamed protein product [Notodromas monacha]|uniref:tRNA-5-taurinomethyluridine 2-sulfurtransferase n=1 Tax=Notodromas monacha TaxID=399045 RepID=A0A7R9BGW9_9CRUS|nr:unnamed protein product [Notodromas monacha]CAG0913938.1 unnamed protein product [Notodromas monacha]